jgi:hypothetical protein
MLLRVYSGQSQNGPAGHFRFHVGSPTHGVCRRTAVALERWRDGAPSHESKYCGFARQAQWSEDTFG